MRRSLLLLVAVLVLATAGATNTALEPVASATSAQEKQCQVPDPQRPGQLMVNCPAFAKRAVAVSKTEGDQVWLRYNLEGVPCGANYVVRFWPMGRHQGPYMDFDVGTLKADGKSSGVVGPWKVPGVTAKKQYRYNVDLDVWKDGAAYASRAADGFLGQCDRGGTLSLEPPKERPEPPTTTTATVKECECHVLLSEQGNYTFKTVCTGDPAFGTNPRGTMVRPGACKTA